MTDQFIPGIYNYCDRWCERCPLTARCRVFAMEEARKHGDDYYAAFWKTFDELGENATEDWEEGSAADEFLNSDDEDFSDDADDADDWGDDEDEEDDDDELELAVDRDPLVKIGMDYALASHKWLSQHAPDDKSAEGPSNATPPEEIGFEEALNILCWYSAQIGVKLARATRGVHELAEELGVSEDDDQDESDQDEDDVGRAVVKAATQDRDGSAKVALIGIERSLGAWTILRNHFVEHNQTILGFQRTLARLRRLLDERFPGARVFQRPGFEYEV